MRLISIGIIFAMLSVVIASPLVFTAPTAHGSVAPSGSTQGTISGFTIPGDVHLARVAYAAGGFYVYHKRQGSVCSYVVAHEQHPTSAGTMPVAHYTRSAGPFRQFAEADNWIRAKGVSQNQEWQC